jgi:hypothetical protein
MMWLHRLALAEELLETCAASLMGLGAKDLPLLHTVLEGRAPWYNNLRVWEVSEREASNLSHTSLSHCGCARVCRLLEGLVF